MEYELGYRLQGQSKMIRRWLWFLEPGTKLVECTTSILRVTWNCHVSWKLVSYQIGEIIKSIIVVDSYCSFTNTRWLHLHGIGVLVVISTLTKREMENLGILLKCNLQNEVSNHVKEPSYGTKQSWPKVKNKPKGRHLMCWLATKCLQFLRPPLRMASHLRIHVEGY